MKAVVFWLVLLALMTLCAGALMIDAWGLVIGLLSTILLLVCGWCASFIFGD